MPSVITFGVACVPDDASAVGVVLSSFMFYPFWLVVFNWLVSMIDARRYFFIASWIILTTGYYYMHSLARAIALERPANFDAALCNATRYAFPDPVFVTTMAYTLVVGVGLYRDHHRFGWLNGTVAYSVPLLYTAATVYTGYLSAGQAAANFVVSVVTASIFMLVYQLTGDDKA